MGCPFCYKKLRSGSGILGYPVKKSVPVRDCDLTEVQILEIREELFCLRTKIAFKDFNKYLGTINSLLNTKEYCRYDISSITKLIKEYGCNTGVV